MNSSGSLQFSEREGERDRERKIIGEEMSESE